jgi:Ketopantoate reductase PanE/ApbA C terminal
MTSRSDRRGGVRGLDPVAAGSDHAHRATAAADLRRVRRPPLRTVEAFHTACVAGGIDAELSGDICRAIWEKFVFLVGPSTTTATMRVPIGPVRAHPQSRALLLDLMREVVAVGRAHGVPLPEDYAEHRLEFADGVSPDTTSSMHHDLERGNRLEVRCLSGGVVELAKAVGADTPLNRAVADMGPCTPTAAWITKPPRLAASGPRRRSARTQPGRSGRRHRSRTSRARSHPGRCRRTGSPRRRGRVRREPHRAG